jgi:hypothetical protein
MRQDSNYISEKLIKKNHESTQVFYYVNLSQFLYLFFIQLKPI